MSNMKGGRNMRKGFTLIELAIVLVIIGLIIGAIFIGGELINSAKYKRLKMDWDSVLTAVYTYQDKYNALPGDDPKATDHFGTLPGLANGNGNGIIATGGSNLILCDGSASSVPQETCQAWWHLRLAGLLPGSETIALKHSFGGYMALGETNADFNPAWVTPWAVCHYNLQNKVALWLDEHYDDEKYNNGTIRGSGDYTTGAGDAFVSWTCIKGG